MFLYLVRQALYLHHYIMILANTSNISKKFGFINISNIINVNIVTDSAILVIIKSTATTIFSFISSANIIIQTSKKLRILMQQEEIQLVMQEKFQDLSNSYIYNNVNTHHYSLNVISWMSTENKGFGVISFDSQQIHLIAVLFCTFDIHSGFEQKNANYNLNLKTKMSIVAINFLTEYAVVNGFDCVHCQHQ